MMTGTTLTGGRTTPGVIRIGETVRRPPMLNSDFVCLVLRHLAVMGFDGVPRSLGRDEEGRDVLGWIEGEVPAELSSGHSDAVFASAAKLIRSYHDATAPLLCAPAAVAAGLEVICHNNLSLCNFVFRAGLPVAVIDFDAASPGTRAHDLGYAAWLWLDLGCAGKAPPEGVGALGGWRSRWPQTPDCYAMIGCRRTESGRPAANIRFSTATPMVASVCWAAKPRARSRGPISAL
jgi:hypothetical protein